MPKKGINTVSLKKFCNKHRDTILFSQGIICDAFEFMKLIDYERRKQKDKELQIAYDYASK